MTGRARDASLGAVLFLFSGLWTWLVIDTIPAGIGNGDIGARAFPLMFGLTLMGFSAILLVGNYFQKDTGDLAASARVPSNSGQSRPVWMAALIVIAVIVIYGLLLEKIGFVLATPLAVASALTIGLRLRSPGRILSISLGLTAACWLIFEKLLGIYLANGLWINLG